MCTSRNSYKLDEDQAIQLGICSKLFKLQLAFDNMAISKPLHVDGKKVIETVLLLYEIKQARPGNDASGLCLSVY